MFWREALKKKVEEDLEEGGFELLEFRVEKRKSGYTVVITIDQEGVVGVEDCARASNLLRADPSLEEIVGEDFALVVYSPGVDRLLTKEEHFERFRGRRVKVKTDEGVLVGVNSGLVDGKLRLMVGGGMIEVPMGKVKEVRLNDELRFKKGGMKGEKSR